MSNEFASRVMLVSMKIHAPQWSRKDRVVTDDTHAQHLAQSNAGRYTKALFSPEQLKQITQTVSALRTYEAERTLPWGMDGSRIIKSSELLGYKHEMEALARKFDSAVQDFVSDWTRNLQESATRLGDMFEATYYPDPSDVPALYRVVIDPIPFPRAADFRADMPQDEIDELRRHWEARAIEAQTVASREVWDRLHKVISNMSAKLTIPHGGHGTDPQTGDAVSGAFHDSLIINVKDLCEALPALNLTDDPVMEKFRSTTLRFLGKLDPQQMRDNPSARQQAATNADCILAKMAGYVGKAA